MSVAGVILAAGFSTRMGRPKALLELDGRTFLERCVETLRTGGAGEIVVVTGSAHEAIAEHARHRGLHALLQRNPHPEAGQYSSLRSGIAALRNSPAAAVVNLVDHPLVEPATVAALLELHRSTEAPIVLPSYQGRSGHPLLFGAPLFGEILASNPVDGTRGILRRHEDKVRYALVEDPGIRIDVDTPQDYDAIRSRRAPEELP